MVIAGAVKGNIDIEGPVIVDSTAIVVGDMKFKTVQINNGATIEGRCSQCYGDVNTGCIQKADIIKIEMKQPKIYFPIFFIAGLLRIKSLLSHQL